MYCKPKKNKKGNRLFTQEDLKNLQMIYFLVKEKGFTLEGSEEEAERESFGSLYSQTRHDPQTGGDKKRVNPNQKSTLKFSNHEKMASP